jgi:hypothetical protein
MYQIDPANAVKKTRPLPPAPYPRSSTCDRQFPPYFPQSDTPVRQHMSPAANDFGGQAHPSYRTPTTTRSNDASADGIEESFRIVNIYVIL